MMSHTATHLLQRLIIRILATMDKALQATALLPTPGGEMDHHHICGGSKAHPQLQHHTRFRRIKNCTSRIIHILPRTLLGHREFDNFLFGTQYLSYGYGHHS